MLTVLGGLAEFESELIRERTGEGGRRAMAAGGKFGRPKVLSAFQAAEAAGKRRALKPDRASLPRQRQHHRAVVGRARPEAAAVNRKAFPRPLRARRPGASPPTSAKLPELLEPGLVGSMHATN
jgi:DNA invertase Pin-like site-specific DNA recombinase